VLKLGGGKTAVSSKKKILILGYKKTKKILYLYQKFKTKLKKKREVN
jgi:hypothetical protein